MRTYGGRAFPLERHLRRLEESARRLAIPRGSWAATPVEDVHPTLGPAGDEESIVRVLVTRGELAEGNKTNVFIAQDGKLVTQSLEVGILAGIMTSTTREILPVVLLDQRSVGTGRPGPITRQLHEVHWRHAAMSVAAAAGRREGASR